MNVVASSGGMGDRSGSNPAQSMLESSGRDIRLLSPQAVADSKKAYRTITTRAGGLHVSIGLALCPQDDSTPGTGSLSPSGAPTGILGEIPTRRFPEELS
jgi:hypothetical protein